MRSDGAPFELPCVRRARESSGGPSLSRRVHYGSSRSHGGMQEDAVACTFLPDERCPECGLRKLVGAPHIVGLHADASVDCRGGLWHSRWTGERYEYAPGPMRPEDGKPCVQSAS